MGPSLTESFVLRRMLLKLPYPLSTIFPSRKGIYLHAGKSFAKAKMQKRDNINNTNYAQKQKLKRTSRIIQPQDYD